MKKTLTSISIIAMLMFALAPFAAHAQDKEPNRQEQFQAIRAERQATMEQMRTDRATAAENNRAARDEYKARLEAATTEEEKEAIKAEMRAHASDRVSSLGESLTARLSGHQENIATMINNVQGRLETLASENDLDLSSAITLLDEAAQNLSQADSVITNMDELVASWNTTEDATREDYQDLKAEMKDLLASLKNSDKTGIFDEVRSQVREAIALAKQATQEGGASSETE